MISALLAAVMAFSSAAAVVDEVPAERVTVEIVTANGSGCPVGTTEVGVAADNSELVVTHRGYVARAGAGAGPTEFRKNCQLVLNVKVPSGFTFGIVRADYRGDLSLQAGAQAWQAAAYYFQGDSATVRRIHPFQGPAWDRWETTDSISPEEIVYAPCDSKRYFNLNTALRVNAGTSSARSWISMDSPDANPNSRYRFAWKRC